MKISRILPFLTERPQSVNSRKWPAARRHLLMAARPGAEGRRPRSGRARLGPGRRRLRAALLLALALCTTAGSGLPALAGVQIGAPYLKRRTRMSEAALDPLRAPGATEVREDAEAPLLLDFDALRAENPDVIGYLYVDAVPGISYPVLYSGDDDFYLHHSLDRAYDYKGSIFLEGMNRPDFADPNGFLYGHNMADGTMFGSLKQLTSPELIRERPHFWVLTPEGSYRYRIFSVMRVGLSSDVYLVHFFRGKDFLAWEERWQRESLVQNDLPLSQKDTVLCLTTCTSDPDVRLVVLGKCVSSEKPLRKYGFPAFEALKAYKADKGSLDEEFR